MKYIIIGLISFISVISIAGLITLRRRRRAVK